jgi:hypothetical protein
VKRYRAAPTKAKSKLARWGYTVPKRKRCCEGSHVAGCRPARPLCRLRRKERENRRVCNCGVYWFPHRHGSGACGRGGWWAEIAKAEEAAGRSFFALNEVPF